MPWGVCARSVVELENGRGGSKEVGGIGRMVSVRVRELAFGRGVVSVECHSVWSVCFE